MRLAITIVAAGVTQACASAPATGGTVNVPPARRDTAVALPGQPTAQPTVLPALEYSTGTFVYGLEQQTIITVGTDSAAPMQDTVSVTGLLTYSIERAGDVIRVSGTVDSLMVRSVRDTTVRRLTAPVQLDLQPSGSLPMLSAGDSTTMGSCDTMEDAARAIAEDIHIRIPANTQARHRWTDSTTRIVCRGGVPMIVTMLSVFEARDTESYTDTVILPIVRRSTLTLAGSGTQGTRRITLSGNGTSETTFRYDLRRGLFLDSEGQSVLQLRFETTQQTEQITQRSSSRVRRRTPAP